MRVQILRRLVRRVIGILVGRRILRKLVELAEVGGHARDLRSRARGGAKKTPVGSGEGG